MGRQVPGLEGLARWGPLAQGALRHRDEMLAGEPADDLGPVLLDEPRLAIKRFEHGLNPAIHHPLLDAQGLHPVLVGVDQDAFVTQGAQGLSHALEGLQVWVLIREGTGQQEGGRQTGQQDQGRNEVPQRADAQRALVPRDGGLSVRLHNQRPWHRGRGP